jgi:sugar lactone lactonase YvrE
MQSFRRLFHILILWLAVVRLWSAVIVTVAGGTQPGGAPVRGFDVDNGPATSSLLAFANVVNECDPGQFEQTVHLSADSAGNIYIADSANHRIRRISPEGLISTMAGSGDRPQTNARCEPSGPIGEPGPALSARLYGPGDVVMHPNGSLIIADQQNNRIRQVSSDGAIATIAGSGMHNLYAPGIPALSSPMDWPGALALDASGSLYFAEVHGNRIGKIGSDGRLTTIAGSGFPGFSGDGQRAALAQLRSPAGIGFDTDGNLYIADRGNHRVRKVSGDGIITTFAGTGQRGFSGDDGPAAAAALDTPMDVKADRSGNVYIADAGNHRVRRVDRQGIISTIAGDGVAGRGVDGVSPLVSSLNYPAGLAIDRNEDLYIADWQNYLVRKVVFSDGPVIAPGGITGAMLPGSVIAISGYNLAADSVSAGEDGLPSRLADTSVEVNGMMAPLLFVSPNLIRAQLPTDIAPGRAELVVRNGASASRKEALTIPTGN